LDSGCPYVNPIPLPLLQLGLRCPCPSSNAWDYFYQLSLYVFRPVGLFFFWLIFIFVVEKT